MLARSTRWGILGTGRMARDFAEGLRYVEAAELAAVGSRSAAKAAQFANVFGARRAYAAYEELVADPLLDIVYVATPHVLHESNCLLALEAGKAVLCEKPFAMNSTQAQSVVAAARQRSLFCMEAMWMHFVPGMRKALELVRSGTIGSPRMLFADFGYPTEFESQGRFFCADLGGGALLDRGVYPLALAWRLFGKPDQVEAAATLAPTGVDEHFSLLLKYPGGQIAALGGTLTGYATNEATIVGTEGKITIHEPLCRPDRLTVRRAPATLKAGSSIAEPGLGERLRSSRLARSLRRLFPGRAKTVHVPYLGNGYNYEASEAGRCLREGVTESEIWPLEQTLGVMQTLDLARSRWSG